MKTKAAASVVLAVVAGLSASAHAGSVEVRYRQTGLHRTITIGGITSATVHAGELVHEFRNGTGEAAVLSGLIGTFCTEVTQHVNSNWRVFNLVSPQSAPVPGAGMGPDKATMLANLYAVAAGQQHQSADFAAAFQMMVWEIVYDYDPAVAGTANLSRSDGNIFFSSNQSYFSSVSSIFDSLRTSLLAANTVGIPGLRAVVNGTSQDQLVVIPLPSAGMLGLAGVVGVVAVRRRRV